jgi:hypothetical protein
VLHFERSAGGQPTFFACCKKHAQIVGAVCVSNRWIGSWLTVLLPAACLLASCSAWCAKAVHQMHCAADVRVLCQCTRQLMLVCITFLARVGSGDSADDCHFGCAPESLVSSLNCQSWVCYFCLVDASGLFVQNYWLLAVHVAGSGRSAHACLGSSCSTLLTSLVCMHEQAGKQQRLRVARSVSPCARCCCAWLACSHRDNPV